MQSISVMLSMEQMPIHMPSATRGSRATADNSPAYSQRFAEVGFETIDAIVPVKRQVMLSSVSALELATTLAGQHGRKISDASH
jgi:hypothetical protein